MRLLRTRFLLRLAVTSAAVVLISVTGCSKKEDSGVTSASTGEIAPLPVLKRLPEETYGYLAWDYDSDKFRQFQKRWAGAGKGKTFASTIEELVTAPGDAGLPNEAKEVVKWFLDEGLLESDPSKPQPFREGMAFVQILKDFPLPRFGFFSSLRDGLDPKAKLQSLKTLLESKGLHPQPLTFTLSDGSTSVEGFQIPLPMNDVGSVQPAAYPQDSTDSNDLLQNVADSSPQAPTAAGSFHLFAAASGQSLGIASAEDLIGQLLSGNQSGNGLKSIVESPSYKKLAAQANSNGDLVFSYYLDVKRIGDRFRQQLAENMEGSDLAQKIPVDSLFGSTSVDNSFLSWTGLAFNDQLGQFPILRKALTTPSDTVNLTNVPKEASIFISISDGILESLKTLAKESAPSPDMDKSLEPLKNVKAVGLGVVSGGSASLFPGVFVLLGSDAPAELLTQLKTNLSPGGDGAGAQLPLSPWATKQLNGVEVSYTLSPLGVGLFAAQTDYGVAVATAEEALSSLLGSSNSGDSLQKLLSDQRIASNAPSGKLGVVYVNGPKMADLVKGFQGNLAMFTGGQNPVAPDQLDQIQSAGINYWDSLFQSDVLSLRGQHVPTEPQQNPKG
ncbi:MAG: hypothetical protein KDD64_10005 [Bdellovibrionales bacterium]|nr:hypothetical protein [Bdellovibrionales bacterium]